MTDFASERIYEFPASATQSALWFIHRMDPASSAYNVPLTFEFEGPLDPEALQRAFEALLQRHEIFRTLFVEKKGEVIQRVLPRPTVDWTHARVEEPAPPEETVRALATKAVAEPFTLDGGALVRLRLWSWRDARHLLVLVFHHIVIDHLSLGSFAEELGVAYQAALDGREPDFEPLELQFADYAIWHRENDLGPALAQGVAAWREALDGFSGKLALPTDRPRTSGPSPGRQLPIAFDAELSERVRDYARSRGLSLYNVLLGAFQALMHRHSGQTDIVVGTPFANRGDDERVEQMMGCFINTLPVAVHVDPEESFESLIASSRAALLKAHERQNVPFDAIVGAVQPTRDPSANPLYQVGFVLQEPPVDLQLSGLDSKDLSVHSGGAMYDLHVWMWDGAEQIEGFLWYDASLFDEVSVQRLLERFAALTGRLLSADPERPIGAMDVVTDAERHRLLEAWNATDREPVPSVVERIEDSVAVASAKVAVEGAGESLSYADLWERSGRVAAGLEERGVGLDAIVGVSMERGPEMIVALLGIWRAGGAYLPLDPAFPADRLAFMLDDSGCRLVIGSSPPPDVAMDGAPSWVALEEVEGSTGNVPDVSLHHGDLAYVIYTSGSTGRPKGVTVEHGSLSNFIASMAREPGMTEADALLAVTTLSFDIAGLELWLPLWVGARVVIASDLQARDATALTDLLSTHGVTMMQATPATWRMLVDAGWEGRLIKALCGGESFPSELVAPLLERADEVWNLYGPTETTVWSTAWRLDRAALEAGTSVPVGRPIDNTRVYVVDDEAKLVPQGAVGELWIAGEGVARGYHARDELTAERFVSDPFVEGGRAYRTGDLARWRSDGLLEHLGRSDDQVKVNGYRIELGEVETALATHEAVRQAVAAVQRGEAGDARLIAFVVAHRGSAGIVGSELRRHVRARLPDYMVPGLVTELAEVPLTPNGKVDRRKLLKDLAPATGSRSRSEPPSTEQEHQVADIWKRLLGVDRVGRQDNFFELGGHSLLAIRAASELREVLGREIGPRELFFSTLMQLANSADQHNIVR